MSTRFDIRQEEVVSGWSLFMGIFFVAGIAIKTATKNYFASHSLVNMKPTFTEKQLFIVALVAFLD